MVNAFLLKKKQVRKADGFLSSYNYPVIAQAIKDFISSLRSSELKITYPKKCSYLQVCSIPEAQSRSYGPKTEIKNLSTTDQ